MKTHVLSVVAALALGGCSIHSGSHAGPVSAAAAEVRVPLSMEFSDARKMPDGSTIRVQTCRRGKRVVFRIVEKAAADGWRPSSFTYYQDGRVAVDEFDQDGAGEFDSIWMFGSDSRLTRAWKKAGADRFVPLTDTEVRELNEMRTAIEGSWQDFLRSRTGPEKGKGIGPHE